MSRWLGVVLGLSAGCAVHTPPTLHASSEVRSEHGEVLVVPVIARHQAPEIDLGVFVDTERELPFGDRYDLRVHRTQQLNALPYHVGLSLPGAVNGVLGMGWKAQFKSARYPIAGQVKVKAALAGKRDLDETLRQVSATMGRQAVLYTWIQELDGHPLSRDSAPGWVEETSWGPVVVRWTDEPYLVTMQVGMALVTADGEVVLRHEDRFSTVLSDAQTPEVAAGDIARSIAGQVIDAWSSNHDFANNVKLLAQNPD